MAPLLCPSRPRHLAFVCWLACVALAPMAGAQDLETACARAVTTAEMMECAGDVLQRVEADMGTAYEDLADTLPPERLPDLEATQTAWEAYAEATARFAASGVANGTMAPLLALVDRIEQTEARLLWLQGTYE